MREHVLEFSSADEVIDTLTNTKRKEREQDEHDANRGRT
jgi:hypothetical protein